MTGPRPGPQENTYVRTRGWPKDSRLGGVEPLVERNSDNSWARVTPRAVTVGNRRWSGGRPRQDSNLRSRLWRPVLHVPQGFVSTLESRAKPLQRLQSALVRWSSFHETFRGVLSGDAGASTAGPAGCSGVGVACRSWGRLVGGRSVCRGAAPCWGGVAVV